MNFNGEQGYIGTMENAKIQVHRWQGELLNDVWEIETSRAVRDLVGLVNAAYVDGKDGRFEILTIVGGETVGTRRLCWDAPDRCRKERVCVVLDDSLEDLYVNGRSKRIEDLYMYCVDFFS